MKSLSQALRVPCLLELSFRLVQSQASLSLQNRIRA